MVFHLNPPYTKHRVSALSHTGWVSGDWLERERAEPTSANNTKGLGAKRTGEGQDSEICCHPARGQLSSHGSKGEARSPAAEGRLAEVSSVFCRFRGPKQGSEAHPGRVRAHGLWATF